MNWVFRPKSNSWTALAGFLRLSALAESDGWRGMVRGVNQYWKRARHLRATPEEAQADAVQLARQAARETLEALKRSQ